MSNKNKTIYLMGGFGNVLFQINYAHNLKNQGYNVILNLFLLNDNFITTKLLGWPNHNALTILQDLEILNSFHLEDKFSLNLIFGFISKFLKRSFFGSEYFGLLSPDSKMLNSNHLFGYFHIDNPINIEFIKSTKRIIEKKLFQTEYVHVKKNLDEIANSWVIHIRGGDYKLDKTFSIDMNYYIAATSGKSNFYVVTNDRIFSESIMSKLSLNYKFVESQNALEDFIILSMSTNKILANSTFSWWAAEFGKSTDLILQNEPFYNHVKWNPLSTIDRHKIIGTK